MERKDFEKCCQALEEGQEIFLENFEGHETGKLLYCTADEFRVRTAGERKAWSPESCEEIASSSESPHGNI